MVPLTYGDMIAGLANKSVDAVTLTEPILTKAVENGLAVRFKDLWDVDPAPSSGTIIFGSKFSGNVDAGNRFVLAYIKGIRDYTDAFLKNKGKKEIVDALAKNTAVKDPALYDKMAMPGFNPDGYADSKAVDWALKYWMSTGELKETLEIDKVIDNRYVDNAIQKLGKYSR